MTTDDSYTRRGGRELTETDHRTEQQRSGGSITGLRDRYHGLTVALCLTGAVFLLAGAVLGGEPVLFALAGVGLFGGVLTNYLTLDRFIAAETSERIHAASAANCEGICGDLGLSERRIYVPVAATERSDADAPSPQETPARELSNRRAVRLLVPGSPDRNPDIDPETVVLTDSSGISGLSLQPTGGELFETVLAVLDDPLATTPGGLSEQLSAAAVDEFDLARSVTTDIDADEGTMSLSCSDVLYGDRSRFDHPLVSLFAVGLAVGLDSPVEPTVTNSEPLSVTFEWETVGQTADERSVGVASPSQGRSPE